MSTTPSSADERALLPCPFCGGAANMDNIGAIFAAGCDACGAEAGWHSTEASAVAGWNQRASLGAAQVPAPAAPDWQPIDTAPKDGTPFLATDGHTFEVLNQPPNCFLGVWSFFEKEGRWGGSSIKHTVPSHWMPLSAAIASSTQASGGTT